MEIINGNILDVTEGIIVHQVNCKGVMGAGLAKQIRNKYPEVYRSYVSIIKNSTEDELLGYAQPVSVNNTLSVLNLFGQIGYGTSKVQTDYKAFEYALSRFSDTYNYIKDKHNNNIPIYFPYGIGCGLAGGDWNIISKLIDKYFPEAIIVKYN